MKRSKLLVDEPGDGSKLHQLLAPGLRPHVVRRDVSPPVHPVPGSSGGDVLQHVFHRPQGQVALAVGSPVARLPVPPGGKARVFTATQGLVAVGGAANYIILPGERKGRVIRDATHRQLPQRQAGLRALTWSQWMSVRKRILLCGEPALGGVGGVTGGLGTLGKVTFHGE